MKTSGLIVAPDRQGGPYRSLAIKPDTRIIRERRKQLKESIDFLEGVQEWGLRKQQEGRWRTRPSCAVLCLLGLALATFIFCPEVEVSCGFVLFGTMLFLWQNRLEILWDRRVDPTRLLKKDLAELACLPPE